MKKIFSLLLFIYQTHIFATQYYVALTGSNSNNGLSTSSAWRTLSKALGTGSIVTMGDTVNIKGGDYGDEPVSVKISGNSSAMIYVIGYESTPLDNPTPKIYDSNLYSSFTATDMPTITASSRTTGNIGLNIGSGSSYIRFENFQIVNYNYGVVVGEVQTVTESVELYNVNCYNIGDPDDDYDGHGIMIGGQGYGRYVYNCLTDKCRSTNCGAEAFLVGGENNIFKDCIATSNVTSGGGIMDYYYLVYGSGNKFFDCQAICSVVQSGNVHGFTCKSFREDTYLPNRKNITGRYGSQHNQFINCLARRISEGFVVRHHDAQFNIFYKCRAVGTSSKTSSAGNLVGLLIREGAKNNLFEACEIDSMTFGLSWYDSDEAGYGGYTNTPEGNIINNCQFTNNYYFQRFDDDGHGSGVAPLWRNTISLSTIYRFGTFASFTTDLKPDSLKYDGCIFDGGSGSNAVVGSFTGRAFDTLQFSGCHFNRFTLPSSAYGFVWHTNRGTSGSVSYASETSPLDLHLIGGDPPVGTYDWQLEYTSSPPFCNQEIFGVNTLFFGCKHKTGCVGYPHNVYNKDGVRRRYPFNAGCY